MPSTPSLSEVIKSHIRYDMADVHTCIPGRVVTYDPVTQRADVQPLIKKEYRDGVVLSPAVIYGAPVVFPTAGTGILSMPVVTGDTVLLLFSERSIDLWVNSLADGNGKAQEVQPQDNRKHSLSDAICLVGVSPYSLALGGHPTNVVLRMNAGVNNAENPGENALHLHPIGDSEAIVLYANRYTDQLSTIKQLQDGSIKITSDEGNGLASTVHLRPDGSILIDSSDGTNIELVQGGKITINAVTAVEVNCATADINASSICTIDAPQVHLNGSGGGVLTQESINPMTGTPFPDGSSTVKAGQG